METIREELDHLTDDDAAEPDAARAEEVYRRYLQSTSSTLALSTSITRLLERRELRESDIVDYGLSPTRAQLRFAVRPTLRSNVERIAKGLQATLLSLAAEIPVRKRLNAVFTVDPHNDLLPTLAGANSLEELTGDWTLLLERIERGSRFVPKYMREIRGEHPLSPVSTAREVYEYFDADANTNARLHEFMAYVPAHRRPGWEELSAFMMRPLHDLLPYDQRLDGAFPDHVEEEDPEPFSYDSTGQRQTLQYLTRTSWNGDRSFAPPESSSSPESAHRDANADRASEREVQSTLLADDLRGRRTSVEPRSQRRTASAIGRNQAPVPPVNVLHGMASISSAPRPQLTAPVNWSTTAFTNHDERTSITPQRPETSSARRVFLGQDGLRDADPPLSSRTHARREHSPSERASRRPSRRSRWSEFNAQ